MDDKREHRIHREEELSIRKRRHSKRISHLRVVRSKPGWLNQQWSMEFIHDGLMSGRRLRVLGIVDDLSPECPSLDVCHSLTVERVAEVLEHLACTRGVPEAITVDQGPELASRALDEWAWCRRLKLQFIQPGKPVQNGYNESFNGRFRDECLNE